VAWQSLLTPWQGALMRQIGHIERLQVQLGKLKKGTAPDQYYDPTALHLVPALRLTRKGVIGLERDQELLDVHHADHEYSRNRSSSGISFNFSSHYEQMRQQYSPQLELGCAGENLLVATAEIIKPEALAQGLVIETGDGIQVRLTHIRIAHPCRSFSHYVLGLRGTSDERALKETLQFLNGGTRGFYCGWVGPPVVVGTGDQVFLDL
jgi:hypothetical protein